MYVCMYMDVHGNDIGYCAVAAKLLWRGAECWNECLKLLSVAEEAAAAMDSEELDSGISDFDPHFRGLIVRKRSVSLNAVVILP